MYKFLVYLVFIVSVAFAASGIILAIRLRNRYRSDMFSSLLYFLVFIFTFGFYVIWGQVIIKVYLQPFIEEEAIQRFSDLSILMGLPFLAFAWLMLIRFAGNASGKKINSWKLFLILLINFGIIIAVGLLISGESSIKPVVITRYYFIIMNFSYSVSASALILFKPGSRSVIHEYDRKKISMGLMISMLLQCLLLFLFDIDPLVALGFVVAFFCGNSFLPLYLTYGTMFSGVSRETVADTTFEGFCRKYDVSPRETDIIREICNGLSNKEISEKLFISLQTVKDHTHRIYIKTNVRSRVQLINLVKEEMAG
jgi:DNA-binding CsgD family transcriptional regulator